MPKLVDMKKLQGDYQTCLTEWETAAGELATLKGKKDSGETVDEKELKRLEDLCKDYKAKSEKLEEQYNDSVEFAKRRETAKRIAEAAKTEAGNAGGGNPIPGGANPPHAEAKDPEKEAAAHERLFMDWMQGKHIADGEAWKVLRPERVNQKFTAEAGALLPARFAKAALPEAFGAKALPLLSTTATVGTPLTPEDFRAELLRYPGEEAHIYPRTRKVPSPTGTVTWPRLVQGAPGAEGGDDEFAEYGAVAVNWTSEGDTKPASEPQFEQLNIATHELSARTEMSRTLLSRSAIDLEDFMRNEFRAAIMHKIDLALLNGNGTGKPLGVLQDDTVQVTNRTTAGQMKYDDFINLEHSVAPQFRQNGAYLIADNALAYIKKLKDSHGRPLWLPAMAGGAPPTILGYPYMVTQRRSLGQDGDAIFGDWRTIVTPVEQDILFMRSEHRHMEKGVILYVVFMRVGGRPTQGRALAYLNDQTS